MSTSTHTAYLGRRGNYGKMESKNGGPRPPAPDNGKRSAGVLFVGSENAMTRLSILINARLSASRATAVELLLPTLQANADYLDTVKGSKDAREDALLAVLSDEQQELLHRTEHIFTVPVSFDDDLTVLASDFKESHPKPYEYLCLTVANEFDGTPMASKAEQLIQQGKIGIFHRLQVLVDRLRNCPGSNGLYFLVGIEPASICSFLSGYNKTLSDLSFFQGSNRRDQHEQIRRDPSVWDSKLWKECAIAECSEESNLPAKFIEGLMDEEVQLDARERIGLSKDDLPLKLKHHKDWFAVVLVPDDEPLIGELLEF